MNRWLIWLVLGYVALVLQVTLLPILLPDWAVPDLLLIHVVSLGLIEPLIPGVLLAAFVGCLRDVFSATTLGLYGFVVPALFLLVRFSSRHLNYESPVLFPSLAGVGTLIQGGIVLFCLLSMADADRYWDLVLADLPRAVLANGAVAFLLAGRVMKIARGRRPYEV